MSDTQINGAGIASPTGLASGLGGQGAREVAAIVAVAVFVIGGGELLLRLMGVPQFILPTPSAIAAVFPSPEMAVIGTHYAFTLIELVAGYVIGASIGLILAAVIALAVGLLFLLKRHVFKDVENVS